MHNRRNSALRDANVLDASANIAGAHCTKLLADLGANIVMMEHPDGHTFRHAGPFCGGKPHLESSGMFMCLCANK